MAGNRSISYVNNTVSNFSRGDSSDILKNSELHDNTATYSVRVARAGYAREASHPAARHKTAADSSGETSVPAAGSVSVAVTMTAALRK